MRVTFWRDVENGVTGWTARRNKRTIVPGTTMALGRGGVPHDLFQLVVEAVEGRRDGFWGCVASGATFKSTGRKRTRDGRAVIAANRQGLLDAERLAAIHGEKLRRGIATPVGAILDIVDAQWQALADREPYEVEWPSLHPPLLRPYRPNCAPTSAP
jgi:hypothetical protein